MITVKQGKTGKIISSSFFDDIRMLRKGKSDTCQTFKRFDKNGKSQFQEEALRVSWAAMEINLWQKGCREITNYVNNLKPKQLEEIQETRYMGNDYDPDFTMTDEEIQAMIIPEEV